MRLPWFDSRSDRYDASRHRITATVISGARWRRVVEDRARVVKQEATKPRPNPLEYTNRLCGF